MSTSTKLALVLALLSVAFAAPACQRLDDPPEPQAPGSLSALGRSEAQRPEIFIEGEPIIVTADADDDIVTAADVIRLHTRSPGAAVVEDHQFDLRYESANKPAASTSLWW